MESVLVVQPSLSPNGRVIDAANKRLCFRKIRRRVLLHAFEDNNNNNSMSERPLVTNSNTSFNREMYDNVTLHF